MLQTDDTQVIGMVGKMRGMLNELLQGPDQESTELTPGQMLLMGFNGLFTRLDHEFMEMLEQLDSASVPDIWKKVDVVREAKALQVCELCCNICSSHCHISLDIMLNFVC